MGKPVSEGGAAGRDAGRLTSVADTLLALCREIASLGQCAGDLQATLSPFGQAFARDGRAVEALQGLDLLTQRLEGVAAFLDAFAPTLPADWLGDAGAAAQVVALSDLARRLGGRETDAQHPRDPEAGVFEVFEPFE